jgi:hypothetical protein
MTVSPQFMSSCLVNPSLSNYNSVDSDDDSNATDTIDADIFETLNSELGVGHLAATTPISDLGSTPPVELSALPTIQLEAGNSEPTSESSVVIDTFPFGNPGAQISGAHQGSPIDDHSRDALGDSIWAPFLSKEDWDVARWAKRHGITSSAMAEFLAIPKVRKCILIHYSIANPWWKVVQSLGLSYSTTRELNHVIDGLPGRPPFLCADLTIGDEPLKFYYRDILASIRTLYGNPDFHLDLVFAPERHFTNDERTCRIYNEMHTGDWWWSVQVCKRFSIIFDT